jgi:hypothetical protein
MQAINRLLIRYPDSLVKRANIIFLDCSVNMSLASDGRGLKPGRDPTSSEGMLPIGMAM